MEMLKDKYTVWFYNKGYLNAIGENIFIKISYWLLYSRSVYMREFDKEIKKIRGKIINNGRYRSTNKIQKRI